MTGSVTLFRVSIVAIGLPSLKKSTRTKFGTRGGESSFHSSESLHVSIPEAREGPLVLLIYGVLSEKSPLLNTWGGAFKYHFYIWPHYA